MEPSTSLPLPVWATVFVFVIGAIATSLEIVRFAIYIASKPTIDVILTKEIFVRLMERGECFFLNAVILGRNGTSEIRDIYFDLKRIEGSQKIYRLVPMQIGQKTQGPGPIAGFSFYTESARSFVMKDSSARPVVMAVLDEHHRKIAQRFRVFDDYLYSKRAELQGRELATKSESQQLLQEGVEYLEGIVREALDEMNDLVQIEPGRYRLTLSVSYVPTGRIFSKEKTVSSAITFSVDDGYRKEFRRELEQALRTRGENVLFDRDSNYNYPQYTPLDIEET